MINTRISQEDVNKETLEIGAMSNESCKLFFGLSRFSLWFCELVRGFVYKGCALLHMHYFVKNIAFSFTIRGSSFKQKVVILFKIADTNKQLSKII